MDFPRRVIGERLTDKQKCYFEKHFVGIEFTEDKCPRGHVCLHYTRNFLEHELYEQASRLGVRSVIDIGGTPTRSKKVADHFGVEYHSCNPVLDGTDAIRLRLAELQFPDLMNEVVCKCKAETCQCVGYDAFVAVHSLYYLTPDAIASMLARSRLKIGFAVMSVFKTPSGNMPEGTKEAWFEMTESGSVVTTVEGNAQKYVHPACLWLHGGGVRTEFGTLSWNIVREVENCQFLIFTISEAPVPESRFDMARPGTDISDGDLRGMRNTQSTIGFDFQLEKISKITVTSFGWVVYMGEQSIMLPSELLSEAKTWIVSKDRNHSNWLLLVNLLKGKVGRCNIPHQIQWKVVLLCAALAFTSTVLLEIQVHGHMARFRRYFDMAKEFVSIRVRTCCVVPVCSWICCPRMGAIDVEPPSKFSTDPMVVQQQPGVGKLVLSEKIFEVT